MAALVQIDARELKRLGDSILPELARQIPLSRALNDTGKELRADILAEMRAKFDRPTPWVMRGLLVQRATKKNLTAEVWPTPSAAAHQRPRCWSPTSGAAAAP